MKSFTDVEQSKKLAEILALESADMCYSNDGTAIKIDANPYLVRKKMWQDYVVEVIPCWSLSALLEILPSHLGEYKDYIDFGLSKSFNGKWYSAHYLKTSDDGDLSAIYVETGDTPVDACYKMVIKLHEEGLL